MTRTTKPTLSRAPKVIIALAVIVSCLAALAAGITAYKVTHPRVWTETKVEDVVSKAPGIDSATCSPVHVVGDGTGTYSCSTIYSGPASYDAPVLVTLTIAAHSDGSWSVEH